MNFIAQATTVGIENIASFGVAGLMGAMWLWERKTSRQREEQLDEAHSRIMGDRVALDQIILLVKQNTEALTRLAGTQEQFIQRISAKEAA